MASYVIKSKCELVSSSTLSPYLSFFVRDVPRIKKSKYDPKEDFARYMTDMANIFQERITHVSDLSTITTDADERRLLSLFKRIMDAKRLWQEENARSIENK